MLKLQCEKEIKKFINYYKLHESPHLNIVEFFDKLNKHSLFENLSVVFSEEQELTDNKVFIFPNGTIIWKDMKTFDNIIDDCIEFISQNEKKSMVTLQLHSRQSEKNERQKFKKISENVTMGQYALEVSRLEREEKKLFKQYEEWECHFSELKRKKIDDILDRYNIQKQLFIVFKDNKYKRKMDKWKAIFNRINKL